MYFYASKVGVCSTRAPHSMCARHVLVAPSVQYESVEELSAACETLLVWYYHAMRDAVTRRWLQRMSTPSSDAMLMLGIATFEDALVGGVDCLRRTTKGRGGLSVTVLFLLYFARKPKSRPPYCICGGIFESS
jgi:hypothetical protein